MRKKIPLLFIAMLMSIPAPVFAETVLFQQEKEIYTEDEKIKICDDVSFISYVLSKGRLKNPKITKEIMFDQLNKTINDQVTKIIMKDMVDFIFEENIIAKKTSKEKKEYTDSIKEGSYGICLSKINIIGE